MKNIARASCSIITIFLVSCENTPDVASNNSSANTCYQQDMMPSISPNSGTYVDSVRVNISTANNSSQIMYTTDTTISKSRYKKYDENFLLTSTSKVFAFSVSANCTSLVAISNFTIKKTILPPTFSHPEGVYKDPIYVALYPKTPDAIIWYNTDSSNKYLQYSSPIYVDANATIQAFCNFGGQDQSSITKTKYSITSIPWNSNIKFDSIAIGTINYKTVKIGDQIWMAQNLQKDTKISNYPYAKWDSARKYGYHYFWTDAIDSTICPEGWRVPSIGDWQILIAFAGGGNLARRRLASRNGWQNPGIDSLGFRILPSGATMVLDQMSTLTGLAAFWTSTPAGSDSTMAIEVNSTSFKVIKTPDMGYRSSLKSIRCIKD